MDVPDAPISSPECPGGPADRGLRGRRRECDVLDRLVASARTGRGQVLVVRGEAGAGKTALLEYLLERADGCRAVRAAGAESETELAFAGLYQLCAPFLDRLEGLPGPRRDALGVAFGLREGPGPDPFLAGLAVLSLLSEAAADRPLVCVVDDVQWLDEASARTLAFVARHLPAGPVAAVLAARPCDMERRLAGLAGLAVGGLAHGDARALLESALPGRLDERVCDAIVAEARGNPGVLLGLAGALSLEELAGGFGLPGAASLAGPVEESLRQRLAPLPPATRRLLLVAAAEPTLDPVLVWQAAGVLGVGAAAAAPAAEAGLIESGRQVRFRDPLTRFAVYRAASPQERRTVHRALAVTTDPGTDPVRWAWHRGQAAPGPDEDIAGDLERAAPAARASGGLAADAAFRERAAELTPAAGERARRALAAAQAKHQAGAAEGVWRMLAVARTGPLDEVGRARAELLGAQLTAGASHGRDGLPLLVKAARRLEPLHPGLARQAYRDAFSAALAGGGRQAAGTLVTTAEAARASRCGSRPPRAGDLLLDGLAALVTEGYAAAAPLLKHALDAFRAHEVPLDEGLGWLPLACRVCGDIWDDKGWSVLSARLIQLARDAGALRALPAALASGVAVHLLAGEPAQAALLAQQAAAVARATGQAGEPDGPLLLAAWGGRDREACQLIAAAATEPAAGGDGQRLSTAAWAAAVLHNGLSHYDEALAAAEQASACPGDLAPASWSLAELVEAAVRAGQPGRAAAAVERLSQVTRAAGTDWALGIEARCRALLSEGEAAEHEYVAAMERLGRTQVRVELARACLLYGEWLRRENRRADAREQLRTAHQMLAAMRVEGFAERARLELLATGETVRKRTAETTVELTPQEARIALLAVDGHTNPEISARLFLSPRTVEWHLRKVFTKLGISSRRELPMALPNLERAALSA
ncbi:LuxR family transcriptional regulator [Trebonia sp.]|uniref:AAA family ATPase n=1 Tax=Trebonia sp. TaxID=2767075 RepID=UPI0026315135|nr:LuxR family transcriptional regulator [Trebonia sp.]